MGFWAATVITSLLTSLPIIGEWLVLLIWGDYSMSEATLVRFYILHFLLGVLIPGLVLLHIGFLHAEGSGDSLTANSICLETISLIPRYSKKDTCFLVIFLFFWLYGIIYAPLFFSEPQLGVKASYLVGVYVIPE